MSKKSLVCILVLSAVLGFFIWAGLYFKWKVLDREVYILESLKGASLKLEEGKKHFENWEFGQAERSFLGADATINELEESTGLAYRIALKACRFLPENFRIKWLLEFLATFEKVPKSAAKIASLSFKIQNQLPQALFEEKNSLLNDLADLDSEIVHLASLLQNLNEMPLIIKEGPSIISVRDELQKAKSNLDASYRFLGGESPKRYILLFQNPAEIRPTGGFIGSFGVLKVENGWFSKFDFYDIKEADEATKAKIAPPRPLRKIARSWLPSDANWFFDFGVSARKLDLFLEDSLSIEGNGIFAINPSVISKILQITGPIEVPEYDLSLNADNFWEVSQIQTQLDKERGESKKFLKIFGRYFLDKLKTLPPDDLPELLKILADSFNAKELQAFFKDETMHKFISEKRWDGVVKAIPNEDFLAVVHSNIGGGKSDYGISQKISLKTKIEADGTIINTLKVYRQHHGKKSKYGFWQARNYDYLRIYVPKAAEIISAKGGDPEPSFRQIDYEKAGYVIDEDVGFLNSALPLLIGKSRTVEVFEEFGITVFATWLITDLGEENFFEMTYRLPFKTGFVSPAYRLLVEKQSGIESEFSHEVEFFEGVLGVKGEKKFSGMLEKRLNRSISFQFPKP